MAISPPTIRFVDPTSQFAHCSRSKLGVPSVVCQAQQSLMDKNHSMSAAAAAAATTTSRRRNTQSHSSDDAGSIDTHLLDLQAPTVFTTNHSNPSDSTDASRAWMKKKIMKEATKTDCNNKESRLFVADHELGDSVDTTANLHHLLLRSREDCYDGVLIDPTGLPVDPHDFVVRLRASLLHWRNQRKRGVWLHLPSHLAEFVPIAIQEGFQYHHAEPSHVMMTYWLPDMPSTLPPNASHQIGIGAFVMNDRREVLAVQEKTGPLRGLGVWKMPTGLINEGEDLCDGAVREVKEETGVDTKFMQVVGFRHGHLVSFGKSDLYFTCTLQPLSDNILIEDCEIEAAKWIPLEEFQSQDFFMESVARRKMLELCVASFNGRYRGFEAEQLFSGSLASPTHYFFASLVTTHFCGTLVHYLSIYIYNLCYWENNWCRYCKNIVTIMKIYILINFTF